MKARRLILTAGVVVALAGPAAQTAGAQLPRDGGGSRPLKVALKEIKATVHQNKKAKSSATAINASTYSAYAYVQGGASQKVGEGDHEGRQGGAPPEQAGEELRDRDQRQRIRRVRLRAGRRFAEGRQGDHEAGKKLATAHPRPIGEPAVRGGSTGSTAGRQPSPRWPRRVRPVQHLHSAGAVHDLGHGLPDPRAARSCDRGRGFVGSASGDRLDRLDRERLLRRDARPARRGRDGHELAVRGLLTHRFGRCRRSTPHGRRHRAGTRRARKG